MCIKTDLRYLHPVEIFMHHHFNIILYVCSMSHHVILIPIHLISLTILGEEYKIRSAMYSSVYRASTSSILRSNFFLVTVF
jgi:hypothetical protein